MGGEGDWRDAAEVVTQVYQHALTDERWVFVQVRRVADLELGYDDIAGVVDVRHESISVEYRSYGCGC